MLSDIKDAVIRVGVKQSKKAVEDGEALKAYIAEDADPHLTEPFQALCKEKGVSVEVVMSMEKLGRVAGIDVGAAIVVILK